MMIWLTLLKKYFILGEKSIFCCCQKQQKVLSPLQCCLKKRRNISVLSIRLLLKMINSKSSSPLERFFKELLSKCCHKVDFFLFKSSVEFKSFTIFLFFPMFLHYWVSKPLFLVKTKWLLKSSAKVLLNKLHLDLLALFIWKLYKKKNKSAKWHKGKTHFANGKSNH